MLLAQVVNSGLGATTPVRDTNFQCGRASCYSWNAPQIDALFKQLQQTANQAASALGISDVSHVDVDGLIGDDTTTLIRTIATRVGATAGILGEARSMYSKEAVAQAADKLVAALQQLMTSAPVPTPQPTQPSPTAPTPTTTAPTKPGVSPMKPPAEEIETRQVLPVQPAPKGASVGTIAAVIGGFLLVGTIIAVVAIKKSRPKEPEAT